MDVARGAAIGGAIGAAVAFVLRRQDAPPSVGVSTTHLYKMKDLSQKLAQFKSLSDSNPDASRFYSDLIRCADEFAGHALHFSRASQFKCNRLISEMRSHCHNLCLHSRSVNGAHMKREEWPPVEAMCADLLHNLILDLK